MSTHRIISGIATIGLLFLTATPAPADVFNFSTGNPDGLIGTLSRPGTGGVLQTETADDFLLNSETILTSATFTGLLPSGTALSDITQVEIEFYHVFPNDSGPPSGNVLTRMNSPSDNEIAPATRDSLAGSLSFTASLLNSRFSVANTVVNGINNKTVGQFTGGEGPATGEEVRINVTFNTPVDLPADHYFFRPEVALADGNFLWLSAPKPIVDPGTPFNPDLQTWIRNDNLAPDWSRIGTDITHQGPFNASFSLSGETVPEPSSIIIVATGVVGLAVFCRRKRIGPPALE
jgi:hypothetical protein